MPTKTIVPIPPSYTKNGELEVESTIKYLNFLRSAGIKTVMTTAGTSQYNLLDTLEIHQLNKALAENFSGHKIIGVPAYSFKKALEFIKYANEKYINDSCSLMFLYPDRFYDDDTLVNYFSKLRNVANRPVYIHGMRMRSGYGGIWDFNSDVLNRLYDKKIIVGIKEENSNLQKAFDFVCNLPSEMDIIVAGGSMRRHQFLKGAGANSFLSGVGNFFPEIELKYCDATDNNKDISRFIKLESELFKVFMNCGWHPSLRIGLSLLNLSCFHDRMPYPERKESALKEIKNVLRKINERK